MASIFRRFLEGFGVAGGVKMWVSLRRESNFHIFCLFNIKSNLRHQKHRFWLPFGVVVGTKIVQKRGSTRTKSVTLPAVVTPVGKRLRTVRKPSVKINIWSTNFSRTGPSNFTFAKVVFQAWGFDTICFFITNCAVWANSWAIWTSNFLISNKAPKSKKNLNANLENYINKLPVFTGYTGHIWNFQDCSDKQNWTHNLHCLHCIH